MGAFAERLRRTAERVEGARAISLIAADGIPVETLVYGRDVETASLESLAAQMAGLLKSARSAVEPANAGTLREVATVADSAITVLSRVTGEYYLLLLLSREGNLGRGRFELRRAAADLEKELL
jgi:predicted regulator of Ras-like GTPase activity (Roadblock/LC7/MglB family)